MKIMLISHEMTYTGAPNSLLNVARVLRKHGHKVKVYTLERGDFERRYRRYGFRVRQLAFTPSAAECDRIAKKFDLVICNTVFCSRICCMLQERVKTILYLREAADLPKIISDCGIDRSFLQNAENTVCISEYAQKFIERTYSPKRLWVLRNFLMTGKFARPAANRIRDGKVHFLIAATVEPRKGIDIAINAYRSLPRHLTERAVLDIYGRKPEWARDYWEGLFGGDGGIIYHGEYTGGKRKLYKKANVVLVPSSDEACSLAALEGARYGRPLIVSENVGARYLTGGGCGFTVKTGSAESLARAMRFFIENPDSLQSAGTAAFCNFKRTSVQDGYYEGLRKILAEVL